MIDMRNFTLTRHDPELQILIAPIIQNSPEHKAVAQWAIDCLMRVLPALEKKYPDNTVCQTAVETLQRWMSGELKMWDARQYTYTVLALARELTPVDKPYAQIVRATSHCLATCHVPTHAERTAMYVISAIKLINGEGESTIERMENERAWQIARLKTLLACARDME